jgi:hypothetical protein
MPCHAYKCLKQQNCIWLNPIVDFFKYKIPNKNYNILKLLAFKNKKKILKKTINRENHHFN